MKDRPNAKLLKNPNVLLLLALLATGGVLALFVWLGSASGAQAEVRVAGEVVASYPLAENRTVTITGANGGTNVLVIRNGTACVTEASCPDGLCINMGQISRSGQSIVCLPNQVVIEITGAPAAQSGQELDVVAK